MKKSFKGLGKSMREYMLIVSEVPNEYDKEFSGDGNLIKEHMMIISEVSRECDVFLKSLDVAKGVVKTIVMS